VSEDSPQPTARVAHDAGEVWTARGDLTGQRYALFAGYARSRDSFDLASVGRGTVRNDATDEYFVGTALPLGRHGITLSVSRFEGADTRHTFGVTWRWSLAAAPWDISAPPAR
jgi:hypothetical protein